MRKVNSARRLLLRAQTVALVFLSAPGCGQAGEDPARATAAAPTDVEYAKWHPEWSPAFRSPVEPNLVLFDLRGSGLRADEWFLTGTAVVREDLDDEWTLDGRALGIDNSGQVIGRPHGFAAMYSTLALPVPNNNSLVLLWLSPAEGDEAGLDGYSVNPATRLSELWYTVVTKAGSVGNPARIAVDSSGFQPTTLNASVLSSGKVLVAIASQVTGDRAHARVLTIDGDSVRESTANHPPALSGVALHHHDRSSVLVTVGPDPITLAQPDEVTQSLVQIWEIPDPGSPPHEVASVRGPPTAFNWISSLIGSRNRDAFALVIGEPGPTGFGVSRVWTMDVESTRIPEVGDRADWTALRTFPFEAFNPIVVKDTCGAMHIIAEEWPMEEDGPPNLWYSRRTEAGWEEWRPLPVMGYVTSTTMFTTTNHDIVAVYFDVDIDVDAGTISVALVRSTLSQECVT